MSDFKAKIIKSVSAELQNSARQETAKAKGAVEYWNALATRAVNRTLQILKDTPNELNATANAIEAIAEHARISTIRLGSGHGIPPGEYTVVPKDINEPRPARRLHAKAGKAPAAKRALARRKRKR